MISIKLNKADEAKLINKLKTAPQEMDKAITFSLRNVGEEARRDAERDAPYLRGNLKRSILMESDNKRAIVGTNLIYAPIQEFGGTIRFKKRKGSITIKAKLYLSKAYDKMVSGRAKEIFTENIRKIIDK